MVDFAFFLKKLWKYLFSRIFLAVLASLLLFVNIFFIFLHMLSYTRIYYTKLEISIINPKFRIFDLNIFSFLLSEKGRVEPCAISKRNKRQYCSKEISFESLMYFFLHQYYYFLKRFSFQSNLIFSKDCFCFILFYFLILHRGR